jgi:hypothetical protein
MKNTVKTKEKAREIIENAIDNELVNDADFSTTRNIESITDNCECGQTNAIRGYLEGGEKLFIVAYCDSCGDDDAFTSDVLQVL